MNFLAHCALSVSETGKADAQYVVGGFLGDFVKGAVPSHLPEDIQTGIRLHRLAGLDWVGFPRSDAPLWYDQVTATLRAHGISLDRRPPPGEHPLLAEVKFAAVGTGRAFALAPPDWARPLPEGLTWQPLIGNPIIRRTWAVWPASSRRRDLATLIAALDLTMR